MSTSTFDTCKQIQKRILTTVAEVIAYDSWSDKFAREQLAEISTRHSAEIDPNTMSLAELKELGFGRYSTETNLWLIPLWLFPYLAPQFKGGCISKPAETVTLSKAEIDTDNRAGCLAYGVFKEPTGE